MSSLPEGATIADLPPSQLDGAPGVLAEFRVTSEEASSIGFTGDGRARLYFGVSDGVDRIWLTCGGPGDASETFAACDQIADSFSRKP